MEQILIVKYVDLLKQYLWRCLIINASFIDDTGLTYIRNHYLIPTLYSSFHVCYVKLYQHEQFGKIYSISISVKKRIRKIHALYNKNWNHANIRLKALITKTCLYRSRFIWTFLRGIRFFNQFILFIFLPCLFVKQVN